MLDLVRSITAIDVEIAGEGRTVTIRRPTLREALAIIAGAEELGAGDETAWREICSVMTEWLPVRLSSDLRLAGPEEALPNLERFLAAGMPDPERHAREQEKLQERAREASWFEVIAEYATAYHMAPEDVLNQTWPFFVAMYAEIDRQRAREQLRQWEAAAGAQTGKIDSLIERADMRAPPPEAPDSMDDEWFERQMAAARAFRTRNRQGEA